MGAFRSLGWGSTRGLLIVRSGALRTSTEGAIVAISSRTRLRARSTVALATLAVTSSVALAACGSSSTDSTAKPAHPAVTGTPVQQVHQALAALTDANSVKAVATLEMSDAVAKRAQSQGLTAAQLDALRKGTLTFVAAAPSGTTLAQSAGTNTAQSGGASSFSLATGATPLADMVAVGGKFYARANLPEWSTLSGSNLNGDLDQLTSMMPTAGDAVHALESNGWLSVDLKSLTALAKKDASAAPSVSPEQSKQVLSKLIADLEGSSQVTASSDGSSYTVVVGLKKFVTDAESDIAPLLPSSLPLASLPTPNIAATRTVTVTVGVKDGVADDLHLDLTQFLSRTQQAGAALTGQSFAVDVALTQNVAAPQAPASATSVDQLFSSLATMMGNPQTSSGSGSARS